VKTTEIRARFLKFFGDRGHTLVPSSSLVPHGDPTLLFTNAGMVQFKHVFLGDERRDYTRAASSQKCVRAGGKHNDLENVGRTARHHTFFEMLGNFSFGDYFKREAIGYAWEFLTADLGLDPARLFVTVFEEDDEAADIWLKDIGVPASRFARIGARDNFWSMGETGPCGPCSEIFYDHGPEVAGGPPGTPEAESDRFVEIWNLVFMQYNRDEEGTLTPLPRPSVDTGMGLERMAAVMQGVHNNYDIDLFQQLIAAAVEITGRPYGEDAATDVSLRVIADHLRSVSFLLADGVLPSNEGRGFVLRRILRRACRHGRLLGMNEAFLHRLVGALVREMGSHFTELADAQPNIEQVIRLEEERFIRTLDKGLRLVEEAAAAAGDGGVIPGETVFTLYDTYGFPVDLTEDILRGRNVRLDMAGFEAAMAEQRERARAAWSGSGEQAVSAVLHRVREQAGPSEFLGYAAETAEGVVAALLRGDEPVDVLKEGERGQIIANQTPFYAESGGQVGDTGVIEMDAGRFEVEDTKKPLPDLHVHTGRVTSGQITAGKVANFTVDTERRASIRRNHTATHLLHAELRRVLGDHVKQAGSLVAPDRLRFDFTHFQALTDAEKAEIEAGVNRAIWANAEVCTRIMSPEEAVKDGAMALFGEKYGDEVRVVQAGPTSMELCGGTHVLRTGDIGLFRIVAESGIAAGVRRIEAVTHEAAYRLLVADSAALAEAAGRLKAPPTDASEAIAALQDRLKVAEKQLQALKAKAATGVLDELIGHAREVKAGGQHIRLLTAEVDGVADLRDFMDKAKAKLKSGVIVFGQKRGDKVQLVAGVTKDLVGTFHAGELVREVAQICGGKGGGKPELAMAGGSDPEKLGAALNEVARIVAG